MLRSVVICFCIYLGQFCGVLSQYNTSVYSALPPLFKVDNYDLCLYQNATFCVVLAEIVPNATSALWKQIELMSSDRLHNYRHDRVYNGICLDRCEQILTTNEKQLNITNMYGGPIHDIEMMAYFARIFNRPIDERVRNGEQGVQIDACLNYEFRQKYNLSLRTHVEYCDNKDNPLERDTLDITIYTIFALIGLLNIFSSFYDYYMKSQMPKSDQNKEFYKTRLNSSTQHFLASFSVCRNYYTLIQSPKTTTGQNLKFLNFFRTMGTFLVILSHVMLMALNTPHENTQFLENMLYTFEAEIIRNGTVVIQIFFIMTGFLLYTLHFTDKQPVKPETQLASCAGIYLKLIVYRFLRLAPSLLILIYFNASALCHLQDGPFWKHATMPERINCREYWWKNIFFINNIVFKDSCSHHTWYLAADMQLFMMFLLVLILISKYPKVKTAIYIFLCVVSFAIPSLVTYFLKIEASYNLAPEDYRYFYFRNAEEFYQSHIPFYMNICGYLGGFICGDLYVRWEKSENKKELVGNLKYEICVWFLLPIMILLLYINAKFMAIHFEKPSIWIALFAGVYKNLWVFISSLAFLSFCFKLGSFWYSFSRLPFFRPLGRISFQAYLWHAVVLRLIGAYSRQLVYLNRLHLVVHVIVAIVMTNIIAFIMTVLFEFPMVEIIKCLMNGSKNKTFEKDAEADEPVENQKTKF